ncbi:hypothetical protein FQN54_004688 [Arachnomyces sp. PD_36]|nr:hypothetical protein FQN54_004688 [Arachnomyces sp. PD_36]
MYSLAVSALLAQAVVAFPHVNNNINKRNATNPTLDGTPEFIGLLADPELNRDSCGSARFGDRAFWVCRDSQHYDENGIPSLPLITTTASWSDIKEGGGVDLTWYGNNHDQSFYPQIPGNCDDNAAGACPDGTRYVIWPNSPPMVVSDAGGVVTAYAWSLNSYIKGLENIIADPSTALYKITYSGSGSGDELPDVEIVDEAFWAENEIPFGDYGNVIVNGTAYLYGKGSDGKVALARCPADSVEDKSTYEFYVGGSWTSEKPSLGDEAAALDNVSAGGQGTYYYSEHWQSYVWIGQSGISVGADFFITTSPSPEGPWIEPFNFFSAVSGTHDLGAYTLQAHPAFSSPDVNEIYITYTKNDVVSEDVALYTHPLYRVQWAD